VRERREREKRREEGEGERRKERGGRERWRKKNSYRKMTHGRRGG
jgi:hypothetical protein